MDVLFVLYSYYVSSYSDHSYYQSTCGCCVLWRLTHHDDDYASSHLCGPDNISSACSCHVPQWGQLLGFVIPLPFRVYPNGHICLLMLVNGQCWEWTEWLLLPLLWLGVRFMLLIQVSPRHFIQMLGLQLWGIGRGVTQFLHFPTWQGVILFYGECSIQHNGQLQTCDSVNPGDSGEVIPLCDVAINTDSTPHHFGFFFKGSGIPVTYSDTWAGSMHKVYIALQELQGAALKLHNLIYWLLVRWLPYIWTTELLKYVYWIKMV